MKQKLSIILILVLSSQIRVKGQDSVAYRFSELFRNQYHYFSEDPLKHPFLELSSYAMIAGQYALKDGNYAAKQDGGKEKAVTFFTDGTKHVGPFTVSGVFSYAHTLKDSVGYTLGDHDKVVPYYFYSGAKGNWEMSNYNLSGIVSRAVLKGNLIFSAGANFDAGNAWRSNDPRMENFSHNISATLAMHYKVSGNHTIGVSGKLGYLSRENSNEYRNKDYQDNLQNLKYINFLNYGYGLNVIQNTNRQLYTYGDTYAVNSVYHGVFRPGSLTVTVGFEKPEYKFVRKASEAASANYEYGRFNEQIRTASLLWIAAPSQKVQWTVKGNVFEDYGTDYNKILGGQNFTYYHTVLSLQPQIGFFKNGQVKYEVGLKAERDRLYRYDGTSSHLADYHNAFVGVNGSWFSKVAAQGGFWKVSLGLTHKWNTKSLIDIPNSQENDFTRGVVYYDYYYYGASTNSGRIELLKDFKIRKTRFFIALSYETLSAKLPVATLNASGMPGTGRSVFQSKAGFTLN